MTNNNSHLSLQANIICLLLALIGSMAVIDHPTWFGSIPQAGGQGWEISTSAE